jgi:hypothetical protein
MIKQHDLPRHTNLQDNRAGHNHRQCHKRIPSMSRLAYLGPAWRTNLHRTIHGEE